MEKNKKVLIVDDSATVRQMLTTSLAALGFKTIEAVDGCDAMRKLENSEINLVVTDLYMPCMDGVELIRKVRSGGKTRFTPVIMLTDETQDSMREQGKRAGASAWLVKPFSSKQLASIVNLVVGG